MALMGKVSSALKRAKVPRDEIDMVMAEAMSGDYNHVLRTLMGAVNVS